MALGIAVVQYSLSGIYPGIEGLSRRLACYCLFGGKGLGNLIIPRSTTKFRDGGAPLDQKQIKSTSGGVVISLICYPLLYPQTFS